MAASLSSVNPTLLPPTITGPIFDQAIGAVRRDEPRSPGAPLHHRQHRHPGQHGHPRCRVGR